MEHQFSHHPTRNSIGKVVLPSPSPQSLVALVVVPCLNEEQTVEHVVRGVPRNVPGVERIDVLVIDDGSSDGTARAADSAGAEVLSHTKNLGLGATFQEAVRVALSRGVDILVNIDGDGQFDPADIPQLIAGIVDGQADMVTASRFLEGGPEPSMPGIKKWGNRRVAQIVRLLTGKSFRDVSCGFRAFSREALLRMNLFGSFTYTQESFLDLVFKGMTIVEVPVEVRGVREFGSSRVAASLPRYARRSLQIMMRAFISYRPFVFFATIGTIFLVFGTSLLAFLGWHYLRTGAFSPHIWSGFVGGSTVFLGIFTFVIGLIGDILLRIRLNQESLLYFQKRSDWERSRAGREAGRGSV